MNSIKVKKVTWYIVMIVKRILLLMGLKVMCKVYASLELLVVSTKVTGIALKIYNYVIVTDLLDR